MSLTKNLKPKTKKIFFIETWKLAKSFEDLNKGWEKPFLKKKQTTHLFFFGLKKFFFQFFKKKQDFVL